MASRTVRPPRKATTLHCRVKIDHGPWAVQRTVVLELEVRRSADLLRLCRRPCGPRSSRQGSKGDEVASARAAKFRAESGLLGQSLPVDFRALAGTSPD